MALIVARGAFASEPIDPMTENEREKQEAWLNESPSPSYWPGNVCGGKPGYTDYEETGPIGAGTPHARMHWFWDRMHQHDKLIGELTGWNMLSSKYRFEEAIADAFDKLAERYNDDK